MLHDSLELRKLDLQIQDGIGQFSILFLEVTQDPIRFANEALVGGLFLRRPSNLLCLRPLIGFKLENPLRHLWVIADLAIAGCSTMVSRSISFSPCTHPAGLL